MNEKILKGIERIVRACRKYGKAFGLPGPLKLLERFKEDTEMVMLYTDTNMLIGGMQKILSDCEGMGIR